MNTHPRGAIKDHRERQDTNPWIESGTSRQEIRCRLLTPSRLVSNVYDAAMQRYKKAAKSTVIAGGSLGYQCIEPKLLNLSPKRLYADQTQENTIKLTSWSHK